METFRSIYENFYVEYEETTCMPNFLSKKNSILKKSPKLESKKCVDD